MAPSARSSMRVICYRELLDARSRDESRAIRPMRRRYVGEAPMPAGTSLISKVWREPRTIDAAHEDTFERLILARIDFLVRQERRHKGKIAGPASATCSRWSPQQFNHDLRPELYSGNTFENDNSLQLFFLA